MSHRQSLQIFHLLDVGAYLAILIAEYDALENPYQRETYLVDNPPLPFYKPTPVEDHVAIVSFNHLPLSPILILALALHPELIPPDTELRWLEEQELLLHETVAGFHRRWLGHEQER